MNAFAIGPKDKTNFTGPWVVVEVCRKTMKPKSRPVFEGTSKEAMKKARELNARRARWN